MIKTDANGEFYFKLDKPGDYVLQLFQKCDLPADAARHTSYNSSKSNTANRESGLAAGPGERVLGGPRLDMDGELAWFSFDGWPHKFYVRGSGVKMGKPFISEESFAIKEKGVQRTKVVPFIETGFAVDEQGLYKDPSAVIRGRVLMQQGRGNQ